MQVKFSLIFLITSLVATIAMTIPMLERAASVNSSAPIKIIDPATPYNTTNPTENAPAIPTSEKQQWKDKILTAINGLHNVGDTATIATYKNFTLVAKKLESGFTVVIDDSIDHTDSISNSLCQKVAYATLYISGAAVVGGIVAAGGSLTILGVTIPYAILAAFWSGAGGAFQVFCTNIAKYICDHL
ncbi:10549_t:CDS:2 [Dentiscutata heterogama]|uniref:10549_t:CDS:1 n=1 Tax=Dentiscutata heterogama TaxID=1316150 RepID=A0ACA9KQQ8_9GLOM|nr:10549_t:CDS:2 [Dentiscutata heterogama]